jgi:hypothetical protein
MFLHKHSSRLVPDTGTSDWTKRVGNSIHDTFHLHSFYYVGLERGARLHAWLGFGWTNSFDRLSRMIDTSSSRMIGHFW